MNVILYSTGCPKCKILEKKLNEKNVTYTNVSDVETMLSMGLSTVPMLEVGGDMMKFSDAIKFVNNL